MAYDLSGRIFGRLTVTGFYYCQRHPCGQSVRCWRCICECGQACFVMAGNLISGHTKSCGCLTAELSSERGSIPGALAEAHKNHSIKHGQATNATKAYRAWAGMKVRCYNPRTHYYHHYGGRGIRMCDEWLDDFAAFYNYLGDPPSLRHSVDRIDNDGNYEPGNVRWATPTEQRRNQRSKKRLHL